MPTVSLRVLRQLGQMRKLSIFSLFSCLRLFFRSDENLVVVLRKVILAIQLLILYILVIAAVVGVKLLMLMV